MDIAELVSPEAVVHGLKGGSKKLMLQALGAQAAKLSGLDERHIFDVVMERERLGSTAVGAGVAIPHGRLPGLAKPFGLFAQLEQPVDFGALDQQPVDLVFLLLTPELAGADHLKALARISRLFRDRVLCDKLRRARSPDALFALLTDAPHSKAA
jgi:nitrogen PTS system EIIA component